MAPRGQSSSARDRDDGIPPTFHVGPLCQRGRAEVTPLWQRGAGGIMTRDGGEVMVTASGDMLLTPTRRYLSSPLFVSRDFEFDQLHQRASPHRTEGQHADDRLGDALMQ